MQKQNITDIPISYTLDTLKVGMIVNTMQIHGIYDTYILIANQHLDENGFNTGEVVYIGEKQTKEMKDIFDKCTVRYGKRPMVYAQKRLEDGVYSL